MSPVDLGFLVLTLLLCAVLLGVGALSNRFFHDRIFKALTPGLVPPLGQQAEVVKVQPGREYSGEVAVSFSPPKGLRPGLVGTIVDGVAEMRDITATIVDLAVRGQVRIKAVDADAKRQDDPNKKSRDWEVTLVGEAPAGDALNDFEQALMSSLFGNNPIGEPTILMSEWTRFRADDIRRLQRSLYQQTLANGWYEKDPTPKRGGFWRGLMTFAVVALIGLMLLSGITLVKVLCAAAAIAALVFARKRLRTRVPRTALGTAAMVQALGFKKYLETAEADQFSFEEAAGIFSRYLPYALVFGVSAHWAKVFGEVAQQAEIQGVDVLDALIWFDLSGLDVLTFHGLEALADGGLFELADGLGDFAGGIGEGFGDFAEGVGDFISDFDFDF